MAMNDMRTGSEAPQTLEDLLSSPPKIYDLPKSEQKLKSSIGPPRSRTNAKWRDWANLLIELREDIASRMLAFDVSEYIRFRSTCKPWRDVTEDPRVPLNGLDRRFRPRNWIMLQIFTDTPSRRHRSILNISTGTRVNVDLPDLDTHMHLGTVDGLLVLWHNDSNDVRLLNPLTGMLIEFPIVVFSNDLHSERYHMRPRITTFFVTDQDSFHRIPVEIPIPDNTVIKCVGFDDSTSTPTLVICLGDEWCPPVIYAKPGDRSWDFVQIGQHYPSTALGNKIVFHSWESLHRAVKNHYRRQCVHGSDSNPEDQTVALEPWIVPFILS